MNTLLTKIIFPLGLCILAMTVMSNSGGRAGAANGPATLAPGEGASTCANPTCHGTNNFDPSLSIEVSDGDGNLVTEYTLDQSYTVKLSIVAATGTPAGYGFQMVSLDGDDNAYNAWGSDLPSGTQVIMLNNGREYFEHSSRLAENSFEIQWTAPSTLQGDITFYAAGIAANGNGNTGGDGGTNNTFTLSPVISDIDESLQSSQLTLSPNPTSHRLNIETDWSHGDVQVYDYTGNLVQQYQTLPSYIMTHDLTPGLYLLKVRNGDQVLTQQFVKL